MVFWQRACSLLLAGAPLINAAALSFRDSSDGLLVDTSSGNVQGFYNDTAHDVRAFLGVPFAASTGGKGRFRPPSKRERSSSVIQATAWPPSCPGLYPPATTIYTLLPYLPFAGYSEDCLTVNVWTPSASRIKKGGNKLLPVLIYVYGGGFNQGGTSISTYEATDLVSKHEVVVVELNYRVTIFGNPNSPYLASKGGALNIGLLDQRFALEWLQKNVAAFGGDANRMIGFGQSAGSISVGYWPYAYPKDPIVKGIGALSASALLTTIVHPTIDEGNFTDVASVVGCAPGNTSDKEIFECMQTVPWESLTNQIVGHPEKGYLFQLVADNITAFNDIPPLIAAGKVAKIPQFAGSLDNEADSLVPFSFDGIDQAASDAQTNILFICPTREESQLRIDAGLPTWRYRYSGIYKNLSPYPFIRTYHTSEVPMWFGSINVVPGVKEETTEEQKKQSAYMQGALVAFVKDPQNGLTKYGWPRYAGDKGKTLVHLDPRNSSKLVVLENPAEFDAGCISAR